MATRQKIRTTNYVAKTSAYPITILDYMIDCTTGTFNVTLPDATVLGTGPYCIKNSGTGVITIVTTSAQTIDGHEELTLTCQNGSVEVYSDGANWKISKAYIIPPTPHATFSSALTQTVASTTVAYPVVLENVPDIQGIYQKSGTITVDIATPATITWASHGLGIGAAIRFDTTIALPTGITAGTVYYIIAAGFTTEAFRISTSLGGAAVNTSGSQSGVHTATCVSRFYIDSDGDYLMNISCIVDTTNNTAATIDIWFDIDGTNLANSNTQVGINSSNITQVVTIPIIIDVLKGQYVRLFYSASSTNFRMLAIAAQANPTRPACPSIILTVNKTGR